MQKPKIVVVVGPTSSGKTSLSIQLAKQFDGEVISADSRQVYKGCDIGTGKVTDEEMDGVPHHLLSVVPPSEIYSADDFKRDGEIAMQDILKRNKLPIIAGGTFFYVDILLGKISTASVPPNPELRSVLEGKTNNELFALLHKLDSVRAESIDKDNPRRLIRAIEIAKTIGSVPKIKREESYDALTLGIDIDKETLKDNIAKRLEMRLNEGLINEVLGLLEEGVGHERLSELGIEYKYISEFLQGTISEHAMKEQIKIKSWQYAKRQMTWLKRDKEIHWIKPNEFEKAEGIVTKFLKN